VKSVIQFILQKVLGLKTYLFLFSWYKIKTLRKDKSENDFFHFIKQISPKDDVLDVGANIGIMSYYMARKTKGKVFAFEPIPGNIHTLKRIKAHFRLFNIKVMETALGNETGEISMVMPVVSFVKKQGLSHVLTEEITTFNEGYKFTAPITRLDDVEELKKHKISAMKMDVENFEYQVFLGAKKLIANDRPVVYCELWDNENRQKCFAFMHKMNYLIKIKVDNGLVHFDDKKHSSQNFFFIPE
jgi:FkbM family methyltransferase